MNEIEVRFLNISPEELQQKLPKIGATLVSDEMFEEWLFSKPEWKTISGRVRVRKQGDRVRVAYKETTQETSKGNLEIEFTVSDADEAIAFIGKLGLSDPRYQQKRRIHYVLQNTAIDIDFWPKIPPLVEIEAQSLEEITTVAEKLGLDMQTKCELDIFHVYKEVYGIDLSVIKELTF